MDNLTFYPIKVSRGRKFKGHGYAVGSGGCSASWAYCIYTAKIWDPSSKSIAYANQDFVEDDNDVPAEKIEADKQEYINYVINETVKRCTNGTGDTSSSDVKQHIRNSLMKKLPKAIVDSAWPDQRSVGEEVEKTLRWASTLTSKPTVIYGKVCKGGKPYSRTRKAEIAYKALRRRGMTSKPEFEACWLMWTSVLDLPDVREKVEAKFSSQVQLSGDNYDNGLSY